VNCFVLVTASPVREARPVPAGAVCNPEKKK